MTAVTTATHFSAGLDRSHVQAGHAAGRLQNLLEALASTTTVVSPSHQLELLDTIASGALVVALAALGDGDSLVGRAS